MTKFKENWKYFCPSLRTHLCSNELVWASSAPEPRKLTEILHMVKRHSYCLAYPWGHIRTILGWEHFLKKTFNNWKEPVYASWLVHISVWGTATPKICNTLLLSRETTSVRRGQHRFVKGIKYYDEQVCVHNSISCVHWTGSLMTM